MFLKKRWSLLLLKHRRQTAKFQFVEQNHSLNDWTLERYKIRHFCLTGAEDGGFIGYKRKNALKTAEMSG